MIDEDGFTIVGKKQRCNKKYCRTKEIISKDIGKSKESNIKLENIKMILCKNMLLDGSCHYGKNCMYAHSIDEQNVIPIRKKVYNILKSNNNLSYINLHDDTELYNTFLDLTKVCYGCSNHTCTGGYNCKNGSYNEKYVICYDDLQYGNCRKDKCSKIHLTKRGLIPYYPENKITSLINSNMCSMIGNQENDNYMDECLNIDTMSDNSDDINEIILVLKT